MAATLRRVQQPIKSVVIELTNGEEASGKCIMQKKAQAALVASARFPFLASAEGQPSAWRGGRQMDAPTCEM